MNLGLITLIFQNMVGFAEGLQWIYCARNRHNTKDQSDNQYCYPVLKAKMVGGLIPAHIRSSTVDVSATGFAPLHTLRHHPSDRITLMSHLQETPSLAAWVQVRWQAASPLNEWMNELKACSPTLVACVCANYKMWHHEWGNSVDWTLWYTEGVHVRGLEETTQPQCHTGGPRCHKHFLSFNKGYIHVSGSGKRAHKEGWRQIILGKNEGKVQRVKTVEVIVLSIRAMEKILRKKGWAFRPWRGFWGKKVT